MEESVQVPLLVVTKNRGIQSCSTEISDHSQRKKSELKDGSDVTNQLIVVTNTVLNMHVIDSRSEFPLQTQHTLSP